MWGTCSPVFQAGVREDLPKEEVSGLGVEAAEGLEKVVEEPVMGAERASTRGAVCCLSDLRRRRWSGLLEEAVHPFSFLLMSTTRDQVNA